MSLVVKRGVGEPARQILNILVEGVENEATACWLQQFPGLYGQGFYWSRPLNIKQLLECSP